MIEEEWRDVVGYEGLYQVSNLGRVKSCDRLIIGARKRHFPCVILKQVLAKMGYYQVSLWKENIGKTHYVHRLIADSFIDGGLSDKYCVNHINHIKKDNRLCNLEVVDHFENMQKSILHNGAQGFHVRRGKFVCQVCLYGKKYNIGTFKTAAEARFYYLEFYREWYGAEPRLKPLPDNLA